MGSMDLEESAKIDTNRTELGAADGTALINAHLKEIIPVTGKLKEENEQMMGDMGVHPIWFSKLKEKAGSINLRSIGNITLALTMLGSLLVESGCSSLPIGSVVTEPESAVATGVAQAMQTQEAEQVEEATPTPLVVDESNKEVALAQEAELPDVDLTFTWDRFGYATRQMVPFDNGRKVLNFFYSVIIPNYSDEKDVEIGYGLEDRFLWDNFDFKMSAEDQDLPIDGKIKESTLPWISVFFSKGSNTKYLNEDGTLHLRLMFGEIDGEDCIISPRGIVTVKEGENYILYDPDEYDQMPPYLWQYLKEKDTYFDVTDKENIIHSCNLEKFIQKYGVEQENS